MRVGMELMGMDKKAGSGWPKGDELIGLGSKHSWGKVSLEENHMLNLTTSAPYLKIFCDTLVHSQNSPISSPWPPRPWMTWPCHASFSTLLPDHSSETDQLLVPKWQHALPSLGALHRLFPLPKIRSPPVFHLVYPTWSILLHRAMMSLCLGSETAGVSLGNSSWVLGKTCPLSPGWDVVTHVRGGLQTDFIRLCKLFDIRASGLVRNGMTQSRLICHLALKQRVCSVLLLYAM